MRKLELKQEALELYLHGYSYKEVAKELEVSKSTAYRWVSEQRDLSDEANEYGLEPKESDSETNLNTLETSMEPKSSNNETKKNLDDINSSKDSEETVPDYELELKKAMMDHEYRMAKIKLEEKRVSTPKENTNYFTIKPDKEQETPNRKEKESLGVGSLDLANSIAKELESRRKKEEIKIKLDALKEKTRRNLPYHFKVSIGKLANNYLQLYQIRVREADVMSLSEKISSLRREIKAHAFKNSVNVKSYPICQTLQEIDEGLSFMRSEINTSFWSSCKFELNDDSQERLQTLVDEFVD